MQYQSFPGVKGGSQSLAKLTALRLPSLAGRRFLDVGCNEGFFCGYALFDGASRIVGMDKSAAAVRKAAVRFPEVEFLRQSWDRLPEGPFDVITLLSALHYADDQADLIHRLMGLLADDGLLVLEISMAPGGGDKWVKVERSIDERLFPTRQKLGSVLADYAWKVIGHSVNQAGDPLQRYVIHVRKLKPYAYLLLENPGSGKTTISRRLFRERGVTTLSGDAFYYQIAQGQHNTSEALRTLVQAEYNSARIDRMTSRLFAEGFGAELVDLWLAQTGYEDFAIDSYVPENYRQEVADLIDARGYFPVDISWRLSARLPPAAKAEQRARAYQKHLTSRLANLDGQQIVSIRKVLDREIKEHISWHLDSPAEGENLTGEEFMKVSGWIVTRNQFELPLQIYVRAGGVRRLFDLNRQRPDVLAKVFGDDGPVSSFWQQTPCGFMFNLDSKLLNSGLELGIFQNDAEIPLARLKGGTLSAGSGRDLTRRIVRKIKKYKSYIE